MRILLVSMVFAMQSTGNDQWKRKIKWRGRRGAHWRRDAPTARQKRPIGRQTQILLSFGYSDCEWCFIWLQEFMCKKLIRAILKIKE